MGNEITDSQFSRDDFQTFAARLKAETELLKRWWKTGQLAQEPPRIGFELETWLVDAQGRPAPLNAQVMARANDPLLAPELAQYNLEINGTPRLLAGAPFSALQAELEARWAGLREAAGAFDSRIAMIGILPTVKNEDLSLERMSRLKRYEALNEQVLLLRNRRPLRLDIQGEEPLSVEHEDVMLESAATSLQLHLQVTPQDAPKLFNASVMASAATVAVAANSPFLFGRRLWEETRIPVFEQAVAVGPLHGGHSGPLARVGFGSGYGRDALFGFFIENRQHYPVLLPVLMDAPVEQLEHLRLHNGTIWRWNRPLVGFGADGRPHLRIEHRVMAAGPSILDMVANAAFYYGLAFALAETLEGADERLPFPVAERNFYAAAQHGLAAEITWFGGERVELRQLILKELLPLARRGLAGAGVADHEAERYLDIMTARVSSGITGAAWQLAYVNRHGRDFAGLVRDYLQHQESGLPVHQWPV
jgi:gamma-glutamyl:cysteine ligase YbdK (ATP-grasp superfamily)